MNHFKALVIKLLGMFLPPRSKNSGKADLLWKSELHTKAPGLAYTVGTWKPQKPQGIWPGTVGNGWSQEGAREESGKIRQVVEPIGGGHTRQKIWVLEHGWGWEGHQKTYLIGVLDDRNRKHWNEGDLLTGYCISLGEDWGLL